MRFVCHDPQGDWISDLEREDEDRRWEHEHGIVQDADQDVQDRIRRGTDNAPVREDT